MQACVTYDAKRSFNKIPFSQKMEYNNDEEWVLLYQLVPTFSSSFFKMTSDPAIYFMIRKTDLENWNFENVQLIFQRD